MITKRSSSIVYTIRYGPCRTLYSSSRPESLTQPDGRGSSASFTAASVIRSSYPATALQILDDLVEAQVRPATSLLEDLKIFRVLTQGQLNSFVDELRDRPLRRRRLQPQGAVDLGIKVDG